MCRQRIVIAHRLNHDARKRATSRQPAERRIKRSSSETLLTLRLAPPSSLHDISQWTDRLRLFHVSAMSTDPVDPQLPSYSGKDSSARTWPLIFPKELCGLYITMLFRWSSQLSVACGLTKSRALYLTIKTWHWLGSVQRVRVAACGPTDVAGTETQPPRVSSDRLRVHLNAPSRRRPHEASLIPSVCRPAVVRSRSSPRRSPRSAPSTRAR